LGARNRIIAKAIRDRRDLAFHPWVNLRLWWLERSMRRTERRAIYKGF